MSLRQAIRSLMRAPLFTGFAVLALALGIGANTSIFSVFRSVLLKPLPYADPDRLAFVWEDASFTGFPRNTPAPANFVDWRKQASSFEGMAATRGVTGVLAGNPPEEIRGRSVTANFFQVMGVQPALGRGFEPSDEVVEPRGVILTNELWRRRFNQNPSLIGRELVISGRRMQVVGILPPGVRFPDRLVEYYVPMGMRQEDWARRGSHFLTVVGRLKPGVPLQQAQAEISGIARRLEEQYPETNRKLGALLIPLREQIAGNSRQLLWTLLGVSLTVLMISCANVSNLLLTRASARQREHAIRLAIGAGAGEIFAQVLLEALLLALAGCGLGILLAAGALRLLADLVPVSMRGVMQPELDWVVVGFSAGVSLLTALLVGSLPAWAVFRRQTNELLGHGVRTGVGAGSARLRGALVTAEVAMSVVLVSVGWMLVQRMLILRAEPLGFEGEQVLAMRVRQVNRQDVADTSRNVFLTRVLERVQALPGVNEAAFTYIPPFLSRGNSSGYVVEGKTLRPGEERDVLTRVSTGAYLRLMKAQLLDGRLLSESDGADSQRVVVVNETFARQHFPGQSAVGRRIKVDYDRPQDPWMTIVGVIRDMKERGYDHGPKIAAYLPHLQTDWPMDWLVVRVRGEAKSLAAPIQRVIQELDPQQPVAMVQTLQEAVEEDLSDSKQHQRLAVGFALLAVMLAALGIFAVLSFQVTLRVRDLSIRAALGARPAEIAGMVVLNGLSLTLMGLVAGLLASEAVGRLLRSLLDRMPGSSAVLYAGVTLAFVLVGCAAAWLPAWRASRVDPAVVLRQE